MDIKTAIDFASRNHYSQKRVSGEDFINHPMSVMNMLKEFDLPQHILMAAVLHDVCENTDVSYEEIKENFGMGVERIVYYLSKEKKKGFKAFDQQREIRLEHYIRKLEQGSEKYPEVLLIKMSDQIDNLKTFLVFFPEKRERKIKEIKELFLPLYDKKAQNVPLEFERTFNILYQELKKSLRREELDVVNK